MYSVVYFAVQCWNALKQQFRSYPYIKVFAAIVGMFAGAFFLPGGLGVLAWCAGGVCFFAGFAEIGSRLKKVEDVRTVKGTTDKAMREWARKKH